MNQLQATIVTIKSHHGISRLTFEASGAPLSMVALAPPQGCHEGAQVLLGIKATHIALSPINPLGTTITNRLPTTIISIERGLILSSVMLHFNQHPLEAIVPTKELGDNFKERCLCYALFNASDLALLEVLA